MLIATGWLPVHLQGKGKCKKKEVFSAILARYHTGRWRRINIILYLLQAFYKIVLCDVLTLPCVEKDFRNSVICNIRLGEFAVFISSYFKGSVEEYPQDPSLARHGPVVTSAPSPQVQISYSDYGTCVLNIALKSLFTQVKSKVRP